MENFEEKIDVVQQKEIGNVATKKGGMFFDDDKELEVQVSDLSDDPKAPSFETIIEEIIEPSYSFLKRTDEVCTWDKQKCGWGEENKGSKIFIFNSPSGEKILI